MQNLQFSRRIDRRLAPVQPLNCHFVAAEVRERGAELTLVQQMAPVKPPLCHFGAASADAGEDAAGTVFTINKLGTEFSMDIMKA
ncbi:MAG: hypothetical protein LCI00_03220 [Chloroflexi bacterium]|nr:hypothetical protein [Chloroflexota bacterium]MCC6892114.1 hypothetical protein [Anaerolineae bacterium]